MNTSRSNEIKLIFLLAIALGIFISLFSFDPNSISFLNSSPTLSSNNIVGHVGAYLGWGFLFLMGFAAYVVPALIAFWAVASLFEEKPRKLSFRIAGALFSILAVSSILSIIGAGDTTYRFYKGGIIGLAFSDFLLKYLGKAGTFIVIAVLFLLSLLIATDFLIFPFIAWLAKLPALLIRKAKEALTKGGVPSRPKPKPVMAKVKEDAAPKRKLVFPTLPKLKKAVLPTKPDAEPVSPLASVQAAADAALKPLKKAVQAKEKKAAEEKPERKPPVYDKPYEFPSVELLNLPDEAVKEAGTDNFEESSKVLEETLDDFGVEAKVVNVSKGPIITQYELEPARGVQINRITSLSDDIARAMKAVSIRVVAPIPGKDTVGVEVPNSKNTVVYLRELLESEEYKEEDSKLKLMLGKDVSGAPILTELADMPHLLIAGATGSGKTVCVNSIIATLLYNASPDELKLVMIDPKRVELAQYANLPHLLAPVVTDLKKSPQVLEWLVSEMENRFNTFKDIGVRNIEGFNQKALKENKDKMPYIVLVIDEFAELMVAQKEVEDLIQRLAQLARAVGIHMILATQRPSVNVITGVIKANFPSRISFKVASKVDSRTVLDLNGAEKLLGKGDMLFMEPGNPKPLRGQACLVSDGEIDRVTEFIKAQREPFYIDELTKTETKSKHTKFAKDEVYEKAVQVVLQTKQASVSMLQRRLGVGYTRAARLVDMMEDEGVVGPYQGSKPREILIDNLPAQE